METGGDQSLKSDINVTPLVDVMLVMLIIFMLVTPMLQKGVGVSLPKARNVLGVSDSDKDAVTVVVTEAGQLYLGSQPVDRSRLVAALRLKHHENPGLQLQVKADRNVHYGEVKKIVQAAREGGFRGAALIAREIKDEAGARPGG